MAISDDDLGHLRRCVELARAAQEAGEHCPMCAAAHAWMGLGRIVYAASTAQLVGWRQQWDVPASPVAPLPISTIAPAVPVDGPAPDLADEMKALYEATFHS